VTATLAFLILNPAADTVEARRRAVAAKPFDLDKNPSIVYSTKGGVYERHRVEANGGSKAKHA
jgi:hypothetical protein